MKKIIGLALVSIIAVFGLTACGGYDDGEDSTTFGTTFSDNY